MEPEGSLPCTQVSATGPYPEQIERMSDIWSRSLNSSSDITNLISILIIRGPFEKFVDWQQCAAVVLLCFLLHPKKGYFKTTVTQNLTTVRGMNITPLQLGVTVTASLCITGAHCRQSTDSSKGPRTSNSLENQRDL
jgi:hypothetical protein